MKYKNVNKIRLGRHGWTAMDAVFVLGMICIISVVATAWISNGRHLAATVQATNNLRQLTQAWTTASQDNDDYFFSADPREDHPVGEWSGGGWMDLPVNDRIEVDPYWKLDSKTGKSLSKSALWDYVGRNPLVYRDPRDRSTGSWPGYLDGAEVPRVRSFSMNANMGSIRWNRDLINTDTGRLFTVFRKLSDITSASRPGPDFTFVLISEHPGAINDPQFLIDMTAFQTVSKIKLKLVDVPAAYHGGVGTLSYADNHVELKKWLDIRTMPRVTKSEISLNIASPNNPDIDWLQNRTTW